MEKDSPVVVELRNRVAVAERAAADANEKRNISIAVLHEAREALYAAERAEKKAAEKAKEGAA